MPTNRRRRKVRRRGRIDALSQWEIEELLLGSVMLTGDDLPDEVYESVWENFGEQIMKWWLVNRPMTRPYIWYVCEGVPKYGERRLTEHCDNDPEYIESLKQFVHNPRGRPLHTHSHPPTQECEYTYVERNGLLTEVEMQAIRDRKCTNQDEHYRYLKELIGCNDL